MTIDFDLKTPTKYLNELVGWASFKDKGCIDALNRYSHVSRGYHGTFHISFLWYCHSILSGMTANNIFPKNMKAAIKNRVYGVWNVNKRMAETIFAHDVIYDATSKTNELESAIWYQKKYTYYTDDTKSWVTNAIKSSADHFADYPLITEDDYLLQWFLGLDLLPLAAPYEIFRMNQLMIRAEYAHLSDEEWNTGRTAFLNKITNHVEDGKYIYQHPYLRKLFETKAKENIKISLLNK